MYCVGSVGRWDSTIKNVLIKCLYALTFPCAGEARSICFCSALLVTVYFSHLATCHCPCHSSLSLCLLILRDLRKVTRCRAHNFIFLHLTCSRLHRHCDKLLSHYRLSLFVGTKLLQPGVCQDVRGRTALSKASNNHGWEERAAPKEAGGGHPRDGRVALFLPSLLFYALYRCTEEKNKKQKRKTNKKTKQNNERRQRTLF